MINTQMRLYDYFTYGVENSYGQPQLSQNPTGTIKIAINFLTEALGENTIYSSAQFAGLTLDDIDETYVIQYDNEKLKVLYVNPHGRFKQVFLRRM